MHAEMYDVQESLLVICKLNETLLDLKGGGGGGEGWWGEAAVNFNLGTITHTHSCWEI